MHYISKINLFLVVCFVLLIPTLTTWADSSASLVLEESFDDSSLSPQGETILEHNLVQLIEGEGRDGSHALRVNYEGYDRGSRRVVKSPRIPPAERYELAFWVRFCEEFDFARGGKLHGLGPVRSITGGNEITPEGWSARLMFRRDGGLQTYVYHQDMSGRYGDTEVASGFAFQPGQYHHVLMRVALNDAAESANGSMDVWVDDQLVIEHGGLRFRDQITSDSAIQRLLFSTFHGGSNPEWAPRNDDGSYKTDCTFFDDITLSSSM